MIICSKENMLIKFVFLKLTSSLSMLKLQQKQNIHVNNELKYIINNHWCKN